MRLACGLVTILLIAAPAFVPGRPAPPEKSLPVVLRAQETNMWCWAASGQMTMQFLGKNVKQCDQANERFGETTCCNTPAPTACVLGGWPEFEKYGFSCSVTSDTALTWDQLTAEIAASRPVAFSWHWVDSQGHDDGGHMMVVRGYYTARDGTKTVSINDPWPPPTGGMPGGEQRDIPYSEYVQAPGHRHWNDYYNVTKVIPPIPPPKIIPMGKKPPIPDPGPVIEINFGELALASRPAATKALEKMQQNSNLDGAAKLGEPLPVVTIGLAQLRGDAPGGPPKEPKALLGAGPQQILYPVVADDKIAGAVNVSPKDREWTVTTTGSPALARLLTTTRDAHQKESKKQAKDYFAAAVRSMNLYFVVTKDGDKYTFIPVTDEPTMELKAGKPIDGGDLLPKLIQAAKAHKNLPR